MPRSSFRVELVEPLPGGDGSYRSSVPACGKELERAVVFGDHAQDFGVAMMQIEQGELLHERVAAHQHRADRMRAAVGRAEHHEARARVRAHALPRRLTLCSREHRAHDQTAHRVREDADRLIGALERVELRVDRLAQRGRAVRERQPPVVGKGHHFVRRRQVAHEIAVAAVDERRGDAPSRRRRAADPCRRAPDRDDRSTRGCRPLRACCPSCRAARTPPARQSAPAFGNRLR